MKNLMNLKIYLLPVLMLLAVTTVKAQRARDTTYSAAKLAADLSVSMEKAVQIRQALNYNADKLHSLITDNTLKPKEKIEQIKKLYGERQQQIALVMGPEQKALYIQHQGALIQQAAAIRETIKQQHAAQGKVSGHGADTVRKTKKG